MTNNSDPILDDLTAPQRKAVSYGDGPLLVVAGAGSGKTRVITRRIAHLVRQGTPPERIVGITFTNKAAQEMRLRVESLVGEAVTVKTFHSLCALILRHNAEHLGLDPGYSIYDRSDSQRVVRQIRKDLNLDPDTFKPSDLLDNISAWKDDILSPSDAQLEAIGNFEEKAAEVYNIYEQRLKANNALDFDDLLVKTVRLFSQSPEVLRQYQNRYLHVLVDEYQDTNLPQHLIAKGLQGKHKNITAVGDPDQMIYTWRGARIENIMEFEDDFPGAEVIMLEQNYRSTANILRAASECIQNNRMRHEKALWTERDGGHPVRIREFPTGRGEARWIAAKMEELLDEGVDPGEIAVLYRTKYQAFQLEKELVNSPVPYQVVDTVGFFDRKPVKDLRAYLRLIINPDDDEAFRRIVNVPSRGIGAKTVERLERIADKYGESLCRVLHHEKCLDELPTRASKAVATFRDLYHKLTALSQDTIGDFVESLIGEIQYIDSAREDDKEDVQEVLNHFMGFAREYDSNHEDGSLLDFMEQTALMSDVDGWDAQADTASLMTLHSAKGLEFDCVFLCGLEQNILPHQRALENNP
ncbi:MAG: ATP-dependent helicase, partial [Planctomycetota bacterium]